MTSAESNSPMLLTSTHCACLFAGGAAPSIADMLSVASDQLAEQLDAAHGSEVVDPSIFRAHAAKYEVSTRVHRGVGWLFVGSRHLARTGGGGGQTSRNVCM
jgi:hypothetical protein